MVVRRIAHPYATIGNIGHQHKTRKLLQKEDPITAYERPSDNTMWYFDDSNTMSTRVQTPPTLRLLANDGLIGWWRAQKSSRWFLIEQKITKESFKKIPMSSRHCSGLLRIPKPSTASTTMTSTTSWGGRTKQKRPARWFVWLGVHPR